MRIGSQVAHMQEAIGQRVARRRTASTGDTAVPVVVPVSHLRVWIASVAAVVLATALYARSTDILPLGDDWGFLFFSWRGLASVLAIPTNYHFVPIGQFLIYLVYLPFGMNPFAYHVVDITAFAACAVLVQRLGWRLTGSFAVGVLASVLFVVNGRPYEAVVWTLVSYFQLFGLALYLGGMLLYLRLHDGRLSARSRRLAILGFYACVVLAVLTYEQEITLVVACALYRLVVVERALGWSRAALLKRARPWAAEFGPAVLFFAGYLVFKYLHSQATGVLAAPGTSLPLHPLVTTITIGLYQAYIPGVISEPVLTFQHNLFIGLAWGHPLWRRALDFGKVLIPLGALVVFAKPLYRWLVLWSVLVVASTILGIGYLASRYLLLFIVPGTILWASLLVWIANQARAWWAERSAARGPLARKTMLGAVWLPAVLFLVAYAVLGIPYTFAEEANWQQASDMESSAVHRMQQFADSSPKATALYMVNLPDALAAPAGVFEHGAYVFQTGAPVMAMFSMPGRFKTLGYVRTPDTAWIGPGTVMERAQLDALSRQPANLVVCMSSVTHHVERWGSLCK